MILLPVKTCFIKKNYYEQYIIYHSHYFVDWMAAWLFLFQRGRFYTPAPGICHCRGFIQTDKRQGGLTGRSITFNMSIWFRETTVILGSPFFVG